MDKFISLFAIPLINQTSACITVMMWAHDLRNTHHLLHRLAVNVNIIPAKTKYKNMKSLPIDTQMST